MTDQQVQEMKNDLMKLTKQDLVDMIEGGREPIDGEYPVSWHVKYKIAGFEQNLIVRGFDGASVLGDAKKALEYLKNHTAEPFPGYYGKKNESSDEPKKMCDIHNIEMIKCQKNGRSWYAHKYFEGDDEKWCKGVSS
jgi:hypothetical protein